MPGGGVDAVEGVFGYGGAPALRCPSARRRGNERGLSRVRDLAQDRLQDLRSLQGAWLRGVERPVASACALRQPAAAAARKPDRRLQAEASPIGAPARSRELLVRRLDGDVRVP